MLRCVCGLVLGSEIGTRYGELDIRSITIQAGGQTGCQNDNDCIQRWLYSVLLCAHHNIILFSSEDMYTLAREY